MDRKWVILVSYNYEKGIGRFCANIETHECPDGIRLVIVSGNTLHDKLLLQDKSSYKLKKMVANVLKNTKKHIESLRCSLDSLPDVELYTF